MTTIPLLVLGSPLHGDRDRIVAEVLSRWGLPARGFRRGNPEEIRDEALGFVLLLTGGTEHELLRVAEGRAGPLVVLSHPGHNSLPAGLEAVAALRERGVRTELVHLGDREAAGRLELLVRAADLARWFRGKRVGIIGKPSPWLVASVPDLPTLEGKLGLSFVEIPLEGVEALPVEELPPGERVEPDEEELRMGAGVYDSLRRIVHERGLDAFTIACFGLLPRKMTACWALARLSSEGIPAGCEGDLASLVALMCAQALTGGPGFLANPADIDPRGERMVLAHCTVPLSLIESYRLRSHFESGMGLAVGGRLRKGPYTLVRLGGKRLEKGFFVEGSVLPEDVGREDLCRTQVVFKASKGALRKLLREPLGNHHVLIPGHHRAVLEAFHTLFLAEG
ncbi:hypothetical protein ACVNPS_02495 [Candidatus Bipolaricaulota sp. J31]